MPRITYTISDLYAYSILVDKVSISDEQRKKFDVIEVGDPAPQVIKRKDMAEERRDDKEKDKADKYVVGGNRRSGPRDSNMSDNRRSSNTNNMNMNERFAPPPRAVRGGGNRNHETFEEGVKYELAQNAAHRKHIDETLALESGRAEALAERAVAQHAQRPRKDEAPKSEELDNLIARMEADKAAHARRSRFFDASAPNNNNNAATAAATSSAPTTTSSSDPANVRNDWKTAGSSIWRDTRPAAQQPAGGAGGIAAFTTAAGVNNMNMNPNVANAFAIPLANVNNNNMNNNMNLANVRPASFGAPAPLPPAVVPNSHPAATKSPLPGGAGASAPMAATNKVWDAADLEKMLRAGATAASQPAVTGPINAADLERMLMGNATSAGSQAGRPGGVVPTVPASAQPLQQPPQPPQPPQQQVFQGGFPQPAWHTPAKQPASAMVKMPMPQQQQQQQQQPLPQQMQMPMMVNRQFFVGPNGQPYMMAPQQPMFGAGMQQPPAFASTNPQLLYQMQQQMQQQNQQRH